MDRTICPHCFEKKDSRSKRCKGCYGKNKCGKLSNLKNRINNLERIYLIENGKNNNICRLPQVQ